jgi:beta-galactosidase
MNFGVAWYPEHWDEAQWANDLRLMREAHFNTVRIADGAWSRIEPVEGSFDLDWLERAVSLAGDHGMSVVMATPTYAPPAWLTQKYAEVLKIDQSGRRASHGYRQHYSPASSTYRRLCAGVVEAMAQRFGCNPHVIGWQIDNEYSTLSYDSETQTLFQSWLKDKYQTLDELNRRWTTNYWSQTYTDWSQIPLPIPSGNPFTGADGGHNPCLRLDWRRFATFVWRRFQRQQIDIIRQFADRRQWVTHNFMNWFDGYDHYEIATDLDFASWDCYSLHVDLSLGSAHDLVRGFKRKNFWVMESPPGTAGVGNSLDRGEIRTLAWQAIAHGADGFCYWQWRAALGSQEQYHGTLVAPDGTPRSAYHEIAKLGQQLRSISALLEGTVPTAQAAFIHSYEDRWAINAQPHHPDFDYRHHFLHYYLPVRQRGVSIDVISPTAMLDGYRLLIAPSLHILDDDLADRLSNWVQTGGHLVLGPRSGFKNYDGALLPSRQPGRLSDVLGAQIAEFFALDNAIPITGRLGAGEAALWAEWLEPIQPDVEILARYGKGNGWLDEQAATVTRAVGTGRITYVGAWLDDVLMTDLADWVISTYSIGQPAVRLPTGVELAERQSDDHRLLFLINHTREQQLVSLTTHAEDALSGDVVEDVINLTAYEVKVLKIKSQL